QLPDIDQKSCAQRGKKKDCKGRNPGDVIESAADGSGEYRRSILAGEPVQDKAIGAALCHLGAQLTDHPVGVGAADVVTFKQNLSTTAWTDHLMTELAETASR